jgi:hypothetical protein
MIFLPKPDDVSQEDYDNECAKAYSEWFYQQELADKFDIISEHVGHDKAMKTVYGFEPYKNPKFAMKLTGKLIGDE